jgi:hypothetical protein
MLVDVSVNASHDELIGFYANLGGTNKDIFLKRVA